MKTPAIAMYTSLFAVATLAFPLHATAAGPPGGINAEVVNGAGNPVPVTASVSAADGSLASDPVETFVVPDGKVFVLTSLQFQTESSIRPDVTRTVLIPVTRTLSTAGANIAFNLHAITQEGLAVGHRTFPTGVAFGSGTQPCISAGSEFEDPNITASMQGYLVSQ